MPSASPANAPTGTLSDLACPSATSCFAVGDYQNLTGGHQLAEQWDGTNWSVMAMPPSSGYRNDYFGGIACPSANSCLAVGGRTQGTQTAKWDGSTWSFAPPAVPDNSSAVFFGSVACVTDTSCFAVGSTDTATSLAAAVVESWDGTRWSIAPGPTEYDSFLTRVTCTSPTFCIAVGDSGVDLGPHEPLLEQWDGTTWSVVKTPTPAGGTNIYLSDVSCANDVSCSAVGAYTTADGVVQTLIENWDGDSWSVVPSPNGAGPNVRLSYLLRVSCPSATSCFAVGTANDFDQNSRGLVARWDGARWSISSVDPSVDSLDAVTCSSDSSCFAIADRGTTAQVVEQWNGSAWSPTAKAPVDPTPSNATLLGVSCATPTTCFAVGSHTNGAVRSTTSTLIERSLGAQWSAVTSPNRQGATVSILSGVSCPGATTCFAVGEWRAYGAARTLVERWDGTGWKLMTSPNTGQATKPVTANRLSSVSCTSVTNCFAVGYATLNASLTSITTLTEHWDGRTWTIVPSPNRAKSAENRLESVSCATSTNCIAVGRSALYPYSTTPDNHTLTERWNGAAWSIVPSPDGVSGFGDLASTSCTNAKACIAAGTADRISQSSSLIESWNGAAWKRIPSVDPTSATHSALRGVSCTSPGSCYAVGTDDGTSAPSEPLVKMLAGGRWSIVPGAIPPAASNASLNAVTCAANGCNAVGGFDTDGAPRTLVERNF